MLYHVLVIFLLFHSIESRDEDVEDYPKYVTDHHDLGVLGK